MKDVFPFYSVGHFINEPSNGTEFEITRFDEMEEPDIDDFHKHTFYEIIWIETGISKQMIDYKEYEIKPGDLFFISPGQLHYFEEWKPLTGGSIMFTADFFLLNQFNKEKLFELSFLDNFYSNPCINPPLRSYREIKHTIDLLYSEHKREDRLTAICQALLQILLAQVQRSIDNTRKETVSKKYLLIYKTFKFLLDDHFSENLSTSQYAKMLHITQHHLNQVVKNITGKTASEVIKERSILEAKRFLSFTDRTISEIAASLNYFDSSYFTKLFKSQTGTTPLDFKKLMSEKYRKK